MTMPDTTPLVIPAVLGWANADTGPANLRAYATDQGNNPRWAKPRARVIEDALIEAGCAEGDRIAVVVLGDRHAISAPAPSDALLTAADNLRRELTNGSAQQSALNVIAAVDALFAAASKAGVHLGADGATRSGKDELEAARQRVDEQLRERQ